VDNQHNKLHNNLLLRKHFPDPIFLSAFQIFSY